MVDLWGFVLASILFFGLGVVVGAIVVLSAVVAGARSR